MKTSDIEVGHTYENAAGHRRVLVVADGYSNRVKYRVLTGRGGSGKDESGCYRVMITTFAAWAVRRIDTPAPEGELECLNI